MSYENQINSMYHLYQQLVGLSEKLGIPQTEPRIHPPCTYGRLTEEMSIISLGISQLQHSQDVQRRSLSSTKQQLEATLIELGRERMRKRRRQ